MVKPLQEAAQRDASRVASHQTTAPTLPSISIGHCSGRETVATVAAQSNAPENMTVSISISSRDA